MSFYSEMTDSYEAIFPLAPKKLKWLKALSKSGDLDQMLDIGCATGELAFEMSKTFNQVDAFDLEVGMIKKAQSTYLRPNLSYRVGDMIFTEAVFSDKQYDLVTCFGNTLVHLPDPKVGLAFTSIGQVIKPGGMLVVQLLNYDQIVENHRPTLPLIDNDVVKFERAYLWGTDDRLTFKIRLTIKSTGESFDNEVELYPMGRKRLVALLEKSGFETPIFYKDYEGNLAEGNHLPLILTTRYKG